MTLEEGPGILPTREVPETLFRGHCTGERVMSLSKGTLVHTYLSNVACEYE